MENEVKGSCSIVSFEEVEQEQQGVDLIPPEVGWRIFSYLRAADLCRVGGVCRSWRAISSDPLYTPPLLAPLAPDLYYLLNLLNFNIKFTLLRS
jgi:hypothetical protein